MASTMNICTSCLRAAKTAAGRRTAIPIRSLQQPSRAFSRAVATATSRPLFLDFLVPNVSKQSLSFYSTSKTSTPSINTQRSSRRTLATTSDPSAARPAQAVQNPRSDESGKPMQIAISPRASNRLHAISAGDKNPNLALRVSIESGGCHGFQYLMDLTDLGEKPATEEDTVFEGEKGEKIVVDESSLELLNGSTVDYTMELIGSQFKITGIPGATSSCGCGTSFDIKL
jgi:iron-sulfur cluster assembly accessory protein